MFFFIEYFRNNNFPEAPQAPQAPKELVSNKKVDRDNYEKAIELYKLEIDQYERLVSQYERLAKIKSQEKKEQEQRAINLFQAFFITGLLPTLTSILGYIFGSQNNRS